MWGRKVQLQSGFVCKFTVFRGLQLFFPNKAAECTADNVFLEEVRCLHVFPKEDDRFMEHYDSTKIDNCSSTSAEENIVFCTNRWIECEFWVQNGRDRVGSILSTTMAISLLECILMVKLVFGNHGSSSSCILLSIKIAPGPMSPQGVRHRTPRFQETLSF
ncbi:hypothetical protein NPIL_56991 [Nephila pilipes]|uniref:Uncharacterized protein n=1 Tax=Nephila pilipes TaxID=299642 RepID=A0A8X6MYR1_NEPPI|nr:hypothetical protein NPIL_56991 [Nephila pilipes]